MIKFGTIGTSQITKDFIRSAKRNAALKVICCFSRDKQKAKDMIKEMDILAKGVDSFEVLVNEVDAIYIASPNGLHYEQAKYFLTQQKHVFLEKPITLDFNQALELAQIASSNGVMLMEAYKTTHLPQYSFLNDFVQRYKPLLANFNLNRYSSRMPKVKQGIFDSVFDAKLGKGSTYDMLVYPVQLAVSLFGPAKDIKAMGQKLPNGSGLTDVVLLKHSSGVLTNISCTKAANGSLLSEIIGDEGTMAFKGVTSLNEIVLNDFDKEESQKLYKNEKQDPFDYEIAVFCNMINQEDYSLRDYLLQFSLETVRILNAVEDNQGKIGDY